MDPLQSQKELAEQIYWKIEHGSITEAAQLIEAYVQKRILAQQL